eukprot:3951919-Pyramimonas_sp.AAC.1
MRLRKLHYIRPRRGRKRSCVAEYLRPRSHATCKVHNSCILEAINSCTLRNIRAPEDIRAIENRVPEAIIHSEIIKTARPRGHKPS